MNHQKSPSRPPAEGFASEGFDLDAIPPSAPGMSGGGEDGGGKGDVIYELGGGITTTIPAAATSASTSTSTASPAGANSTVDSPKTRDDDLNDDPLTISTTHKATGNAHFKAANYPAALDSYTAAIDTCPGKPTGVQLLQLKEKFDEEQRERAAELHSREMEKRRKKDMKEADRRRKEREEGAAKEGGGNVDEWKTMRRGGGHDKSDHDDEDGSNQSSDSDDEDGSTDDDSDKDNNNKKDPPAKFVPPTVHPHASTLSIYHANRAATYLHLHNPTAAVNDCTIAILLNPTYVKAYLRRSAAFEMMDNDGKHGGGDGDGGGGDGYGGDGGYGVDGGAYLTDALTDARTALQLDPRNPNARKAVVRLEKLEAQRLEKLKEETMGKLKDLGNSILGNFGLSLDNFKAVKDESTGSYNISFDQNGGGGGGK